MAAALLAQPHFLDDTIVGPTRSWPKPTQRSAPQRLLELLLGAELVGVAALLLSAVGGTRWETSVASTEGAGGGGGLGRGSREVHDDRSEGDVKKQHQKKHTHTDCGTYFRQIIFSQLYLLANALSEGSMIPPRRRNTKCNVDSFWML